MPALFCVLIRDCRNVFKLADEDHQQVDANQLAPKTYEHLELFPRHVSLGERNNHQN
ncbi:MULTISPECIES: hypothetical protein [Fischerella]|uniref:hypothetical protein n=1 Tax=Fischerella TaxID=1190 RepID=UPI0012F93CA2|nr:MULTISPECIES: hypothetical protein [Fischerella]MBD2429645.1 hypothetical protein [Fischerella sp. FACHB-380]